MKKLYEAKLAVMVDDLKNDAEIEDALAIVDDEIERLQNETGAKLRAKFPGVRFSVDVAL